MVVSAARSSAIDQAHRVLGQYTYDFYTCDACRRLVTQPQMMRGLQKPEGICICPCGGLKFRPTRLRVAHYLLPRVWAFAWQRARELGWAGCWAGLQDDFAYWTGKRTTPEPLEDDPILAAAAARERARRA